jgi:hypothetical protein
MGTSPSIKTPTRANRLRGALKLNHRFFRRTAQPLTERTDARMAKKPKEHTLQNSPECMGAFSPRLHVQRHVFHFLSIWHIEK